MLTRRVFVRSNYLATSLKYRTVLELKNKNDAKSVIPFMFMFMRQVYYDVYGQYGLDCRFGVSVNTASGAYNRMNLKGAARERGNRKRTINYTDFRY